MDLIKLTLEQKNYIYDGLVLIKGLIYPIPKKDDILSVEKIYLKHTQEFELKLYIEGKVIEESQYSSIEGKKKIYSFEDDMIYKTLSELTGINLYDINSTIFRIINIIDNKSANIQSIYNSNNYIINLNNKQIKEFKLNDFLWVSCYELNKNKIISNKMTIIRLINEEELISFLDINQNKNTILFHVIDINDKDIILINNMQIIYKLDKNNEFIKNHNIGFCRTIIISNYNIDNDNRILLTDKSFLYQLKFESYYIENTIFINSVSILELHFLDYNKENNKFNCISSIFFDDKIITNEIEYIIFTSLYLKKYEFYPIKLKLYNSKNNDINPLTFSIYIYPGFINKINVFLNTNSSNTYFFEYLYYNINDNLEDTIKCVNINGIDYKININYNFGSKNRKRISIMNIPYQKMEIPETDLKTNSIQVCELIKDGIHKIIGIYDILNLEYDELEKSTDYFDEYYEYFGDIYDIMKSYNFEVIIKKIKEKQEIYNKIKLNISILDTNNFNKSLTLSQFKTWFSLIIFKLLEMKKEKTDTIIEKIIKEFFSISLEIRNINLKYIDIIRIWIYSLVDTILNDSDSNHELKFISKIDKRSPYVIAFEFNKQIINSLNEFHPLFQAYLQLDSYKAFNYIHSEVSHTFSLEIDLMIKHQLLSTYDNFFFIKREDSKEYSFIHNPTRITVINELTTLGKNYKESEIIDDPNKCNNYAMPIFIDFLHEKGGHHKYSLKNKGDISPCIYFRGLRTEIEVSHIYSKGLLGGESGRIIENFICKDKNIIDALSKKYIFGELLVIKYFDGKDFTELINEIKNKLEKEEKENQNKKNYNNKNNQDENRGIININNDKKLLLLNLPSSGKIGDVILNVDRIKRNIMMSNEEKEVIYKENLFERKKKIVELKKEKNISIK